MKKNTPTEKMKMLLDELGVITGEGGSLVAHCPAHDDTHPSLVVGVGESGRLLLHCRAGCGFDEVKSKISIDVSSLGWELPEGYAPAEAVDHAPVNSERERALLRLLGAAQRDLTEEVRTHARERFGLSDIQIDEARLGFTPRSYDDTPLCGRKWVDQPRLVVPFFDVLTGYPAGAQGRALTADAEVRWTSLNGSDWAKAGIFGRHSPTRPELIVCEGPSDALTVVAAGYVAVAIRGAAQRSTSMMQAIAEHADGKTVIVAGDSDKAGKKFAKRTVDALLSLGVDARRLKMKRHNDLNDWFQISGGDFAAELNRAVGKAKRQPAPVEKTWDAGNSRPAGLPDPSEFFGPGGLDFDKLEEETLKLGPITAGPGGQLYHYSQGVWSNRGAEKLIKTRVRHLLGSKKQTHHALNLIDTLSAYPSTIPEEGQPTTHLNCLNGLLNLDTLVLEPHTPHLMSTYQVPIEWDPAATCPRYENWLRNVSKYDPDLTALLWELTALAVTPGGAPVHRAAMLTGSGRNGKGTYLRMVGRLVGDEHRSSMTLQSLSEDKFAAAELFGMQVNICGDLSDKFVRFTDFFKMATGGDRLTAQRKYGHPFSFTNRALMMFSANSLPGTADATEGFWSRWLILPFDQSYLGNEDASIEEGLCQELPGILVAVVKTIQKMRSTGWQLTQCDRVNAALEQYRVDADPIRTFVEDNMDLSIGHKQNRSDIYRDYVVWCEANGRNTMSSNKFYERLTTVPGIESIDRRGDSARNVVGGRLKSFTEPAKKPAKSAPAPASLTYETILELKNASIRK